MSEVLDTVKAGDVETGVADSELCAEHIDEVVQRLNGICRTSSLEFALKVGAVVIHHFYEGDTTAWRSRGPKVNSFRRLAELLSVIRPTLRRGEPVISSFELALLQERRPRGVFRPHFVGVVGCDPCRGRFRIMESVKGELDIGIDAFAAAFERYTAHGEKFLTVKCSCTAPGQALPLDRAMIAADLARSLDNLNSAEPNSGINALRRLSVDVQRAHDVLRRPFYIPGMWIFSHDRHCLRRALPYWRAAVPAARNELDTLDRGLRRAFDLWFQADMTIERSISEKDELLMQNVATLLKEILGAEQELVETLQQLSWRINGSAGS